MPWVTFGHHVGGLKGGVGDFGNGELLMISFLGTDDGRVGGEHEMDSGVGHQVGLEFRHIHVQGTVKSERCSQGGNNL